MVDFTRDELHDLGCDAYHRCDDKNKPECQRLALEVRCGFVKLSTIRALDEDLVKEAIARKQRGEPASID